MALTNNEEIQLRDLLTGKTELDGVIDNYSEIMAKLSGKLVGIHDLDPVTAVSTDEIIAFRGDVAKRTNLSGVMVDIDTDGAFTTNSDTKVPSQKAVRTYISTRLAGLSWKQPVRVATTVNGNLASAFTNGQGVDGVTLATDDRILLKNQTTPGENGIYTVNASGAPTRAIDADAGSELVNASVYVSEGTVNSDTQWVCTNNAPITVGTTPLTFVQFATNSDVATKSGTETLTNKTLVSPTLTGTASAVNLSYSGTLTGGAGIVNIGPSQIYKDASGKVGFGTTSLAAQVEISAAAGDGLNVASSPASNTVNIKKTGTPTGNFLWMGSSSGAQYGSVSVNGSGVSYGTTSDLRLKDAVTDAPDAGENIDAVRVVSYVWKNSPDETVKYGFIAQELAEVVPAAVNVGDDGEEIEKVWEVDYSKLVPMLVKELQSLRVRIATLEAKK